MQNPDGDGVMVPAGLARPLAKLAITGAKMLSDRNGGLVLVPGIASLLAELASVAGDGAPSSVRSVQFAPALGSWLSAREASEVSGYSASRLRELARGGRIIVCRRGDRWLYDADSITAYRKDQVA